MTRLHVLFATGMLSLSLCDAGPTGYLPRAGPTPLRFGPKPGSRPVPDLPPLAMTTPKPVDPDLEEPGGSGLGTGYWLPPDPQNQPAEINTAASASAIQEPGFGGLSNTPGRGWWDILVTNQHGFLVVPAPRVDFVPPPTSTPGSRATFNTTP